MFYKGKYFAPSERKRLPLGSMMMRLTAVLTCLVLLSFHLMGGMFAKYSSTATGSDSARVASFNVDVVYDQETGELTITNLSEVTVICNVVISPSISPLALGDGEVIISPQFEAVGGSNTIAPGDTLKGYVTYSDNSTAAHNDITYIISVEVSQVD